MAKPFKVFGIGLNKTGTTSLKLALRRLGFHHYDRRPKMLRLWRRRALDAIWAEIAPYESFEDWPWPLMHAELLDRYGDGARFVLTRRRSAEAWLESLKRHALKTNPDHNPRRQIYGHDYPQGHEAAHIDFYNRHLDAVREGFARHGAEDLLLEVAWDEGDGWPELCPFLGEPMRPGAFPHGNRDGDDHPDPDRVAENLARIRDAQG